MKVLICNLTICGLGGNHNLSWLDIRQLLKRCKQVEFIKNPSKTKVVRLKSKGTSAGILWRRGVLVTE